MLQRSRIGFVGVGNMGQAAHLANYACLEDCEVVTLAEPRSGLAAQVASRYGVPAVYSNAEDMIERERLDGLVVPQPFGLHGSIVKPLYRFGIPILTEKPLASSVEMAEQMVAELAKYGSWHMVGYHKRDDPATVWATQQIANLRVSGDAGKLRYVRITMPPGDWIAGGFDQLIRSDEAPPASKSDPVPPDMSATEFTEYVRFVNYYIHQVNLLRLLLGEPYRVAYADANDRLLVVETKSGVTGTIEMAPYETRIGWEETALVGFDKGCVRLTLPAPLANARCGTAELMISGDTETLTRPTLPHVSAMRMQAKNFVASIRGEAKPACEALEALADLRIARDWLRKRPGSA